MSNVKESGPGPYMDFVKLIALVVFTIVTAGVVMKALERLF
ncbi:MAG TPA: hypothetical protein VG826_26145 [Pirellulales bacterium]|nr:hypothetical protein [Pirellulales bacterium]